MSTKTSANCRLMLRLSMLVPILGLGGALFLAAPVPAVADDQETLQPIVVTAEKREENARDVPITMTVFNGATIQAEGFTGLTDYAKFVPGLVYNGSGLGERSGPDIVIRGVANSRLFDFETNIGTNTTGFVYGDLPTYAFDPELIDVQRIEVLKGPQGTLYGASAMGGLVKVVPNLPEFREFSGQFTGGVSALDSGWNGGGGGWKFSTVVNTPLSDVLALRFSFHSSVDPGYINIHQMSGSPKDQYGPNGLVGYNSLQSNVYGAGEFTKNANKSENGGGRIALRFKPNDAFDATLAFMYDSKVMDSLPNYEPVLSTSQSPLTADQFQLQPSSTHYSLASLEASYDFGPAVLHSITGWIERNHSSSVDFAGTTYGALGGNGSVPLPTPAPVTFAVGTRILSQELRLQGNEKDLLWSGSGLDWTVGGFYQREKRDAVGGVTVGAAWLDDAQAPLRAPPSGTLTVWDGQYVATYTNKAFFADATLHITPRLSVSLGARHSVQDVEATRTDFSDVFASAPPTGNSVIQEPVSESKTTPRATVTFAATDEVNLYAAFSKGFRIGGHNPIGNLSTPGCANALARFGLTDPASAAEFKSDQIKNVEAGIKSAFANGRVTANLTVFRVDWTDLQTTINLDQYDNGCGASFVGNAGAARINGVDAELHALLTDHLQMALSGQYADGKIVSVVAGSAGKVGAPLESAPKTQVTAGFEYKLQPRPEWNSTARLDYAYVGQRNLSNTNTPVDPNYQLPGYGEVNLRFATEHDGWQYTTYVTNLTNAIPQIGVGIYAGGPGDYTGAFAPRAQRFVTTSPPRTFGVEILKSF
ncbi:MAG TPA: TonB-dependent receptor [Steroidobacteraceae bacterium]|nr:TonB-dependent receptor [Steroidobacteraceae bacterium]